MIWIVLTALVLAGAFYLDMPLSGRAGRINRAVELKTYADEIMTLEGKELSEAMAARKVQLQRRVLEITDANDAAAPTAGGSKLLSGAVLTGLLIFSAGLYSHLGRPDMARTVAVSEPAPQTPPSQAQLAAQMAELLEKEPENANGWTLYARLLMSMGRLDDGLEAYGRASALNPSPDLQAEIDSAAAFVAQARAARDMPAQDRMDMINGMVDSLAARLAQDPDNPEGWVRLLTSRRVLGQTEQLASDIVAVRETFKDRPQIAAQIFEQSQALK